MIRYMAQFKDGLAIAPGAMPLAVSYRAASSGIGTVRLKHPLLTDVFPQAEPAALLRVLFNQVSEELDPYSRWLGRNPDGASTLAAAAMLPTELLMRSTGAIRDLKTWADGKLGTEKRIPVAASELIALWHGTGGTKLTKSESIQMAQLLGRLNVGIEPDPRFGGPPLTKDTTAVLFRSEPAAPETSSPEYVAASVLVHLAAAVGTSDGNVTRNEVEILGQHLESAMQLSTPERMRLQAHLQWLATTGIKLTGLKKRFSAIDASMRESVGAMLVSIASIDGSISPAEVTTLSRIYTLLGLDPATVTSHLHSAMTTPRRGPVVVRKAVAGEPGVDIPPRPSFFLDAASIQAKLAETAAVSSLLGDIFVEDEPAKSSPPVPAQPVSTIVGLDDRHAGLFHELATKDEWSRQEFNALAERAALMPEGAIDTLNEAAYETAGEPLLEGDDPIVINTFAREEMSA
jgi:tellurite resistance protein